MSKCGWISIHRKIQDNWVWTDAACLKAWLSIIMEVNHAPKKVLIKGQLVNCERGQSLNSLSKWGEIFGSWSTKRVRTFLKNLEADKMIEIESVRITTRLTVCNYDEYQGDGHAEETQKKRKGNAEESQRKRRLPTNNNGNNGNNEKNEKKDYSVDAERVAEYFLNCIISHKPNLAKPNMKSWASELERAIRIDGRTPRELCEVAKWASQDVFWQSNIMSAKKLRKQFDQLQSKMSQPQNKTMEQHGEEWLALAED